MSHIERRVCARRPLCLPVKLRSTGTGKYVTGQTRNLSATGAMLEVHQPTNLVRGQRMDLGIAWHPRQAVLGSDQLVTATVMRCFGLGGTQQVAVRFDHPLELAATA